MTASGPNKKDGNERASSLYRTEAAAVKEAARMLHESGGGELKIKGEGRQDPQQDTIAPAHDPVPPRDKRAPVSCALSAILAAISRLGTSEWGPNMVPYAPATSTCACPPHRTREQSDARMFDETLLAASAT